MSEPTAEESARMTEEAAQWLESIERTLKPTESAALRNWLRSSAHRRTIVERCRLWHGPEVLAVLQELVPVDTFKQQVERQYGRIVLAVFLGISGITFATVVIAVSKFWSRTEEAWTMQRAEADLRTTNGEARTIRLPDGSLLEMRATTRVLVSYRPQVREITLLHGHAQIAATADLQRTFILHAGVRAFSVDHLAARFDVQRHSDHVALQVLEGQVTALASRGPTAMTPALLRARAGTGAQVVTSGELGHFGAGWQLVWPSKDASTQAALKF